MTVLLPFGVRPCGDAGLTVEFGDSIDPQLHCCVMALDQAVCEAQLQGIIETVPTYRSLLIHYDPVVIGFAELLESIHSIAATCDLDTELPGRKLWNVPVVFGDEFGVDVDYISGRAGVTPRDLIAHLCSAEYLVYMIGFSPGVAYLGGLDPRFEAPRRQEPRMSTPSGSVLLGGQQLAVQALAGPSGWHLLGRTPVRSYLRTRDPMFLFSPSDRIRFDPRSADEWADLERAAASGELLAERLS